MVPYPTKFCKKCVPDGKEGTMLRHGTCHVCKAKGLVFERNELIESSIPLCEPFTGKPCGSEEQEA